MGKEKSKMNIFAHHSYHLFALEQFPVGGISFIAKYLLLKHSGGSFARPIWQALHVYHEWFLYTIFLSFSQKGWM